MENLDDKNCSFLSCINEKYSFSREVSGTELVKAASCVLEQKAKHYDIFCSCAKTTSQYLRMKLGHQEREVFACLFLTSKHRLISYEEMFCGTIDGASVHPREVVKQALLVNSAAVIVAHNHPSGDVTASMSDRNITEKLKSALALFDIRLLDHFIVSSSSEAFSFAERGML